MKPGCMETSDDDFGQWPNENDRQWAREWVTDQLSYIMYIETNSNNIPSTRMTKPERMDHDHGLCVIWTSAWSSENAIASLRLLCAVQGHDNEWVWWRLRVRSKTTTWKVNSEPAIELASPRTRRSERNTRVDTSCPRPEHQQHCQHGLTTVDKDEEPAIKHRRGRADYGATEWIDMRQSSTARASTTCSMATLKPGSRILETEPESLWRLSGHTFTSTARAYTCSTAGQKLWRHRTINYSLAKRWPRDKSDNMDREQGLRKRRRASSQGSSEQATTSTTTSRTTTWMTAETTTTSTKTIDHRTGIWLWTVPEKWFGTVKQKCK